MDRARRAAVAALVLTWSLSLAALAGMPATRVVSTPLETVAWPGSTLVVSEVETGGASASDEFIEIANQGAGAVDLAGLEVAYVTSSGGTVTRKATWTAATPLDPGRRVLLANGLGVHAAASDVVYSGGLAATGGAIVLRPIGGAPIDAVAWGDATNAFVEGTAAPAPPAGSSIERRPGGIEGNGVDTNDNAADWFVQAAPSPQGLAAPPIPAPAVTPPPTDSPAPSASPTPSATAGPSDAPTPPASPSASASPSETPTASPSESPAPTLVPSPPATVEPSPPPPSPSPTPSPTEPPSASPAPTASAEPLAIADARALPNGATVTISGVLTTALGALDAGHTGFVEDETAGIALYLDVAALEAWPAGTLVVATGVLDERYAQRIVRLSAADLAASGVAPLPVAPGVPTGSARESLEGRRISVGGTVIGSPSAVADGTAVTIDDGTGELRVVVSPLAVGAATINPGTRVAATGPLGQRDSSGTGSEGYRVNATEPGELSIVPDPTPSPSESPSPGPSATPTPAPTATATPPPTAPPSPSPTATPAPTSVTIAEARLRAVGAIVSVRGVVTAEAGRLGTPPLVAIQDATAGIVVRLPDGAPSPARGVALAVTGPLAAPYGQLEIRPAAADVATVGLGVLPAPVEIATGDLGEGTEARLVSLAGRIERKAVRATSGDLGVELTVDGVAVRLVADASSGLEIASFEVGASYRVTGIAGQRASRKGVLDGYRIWLRDRADLVKQAPSPSSAGPSPTPSILPIARALLARDGSVSIDAVVTAGPQVLDDSGRRIVVQDATAAVEVYLPAEAAAPSIGDRVEVTGSMGRAYGAARLKATTVAVTGRAAVPGPLPLVRAPGAADDWRLARIAGIVVDVKRLGDRWRAEVAVGRVRIPVSGLPGSRIPSTALVEGHSVTIIGIVRRPYPGASDTRFAIVPRSPADVALGPAATTSGGLGGGGRRPGSDAGPADGVVDVDLARLDEYTGRVVRVGGLIVTLRADGFTLDDATAVGTIVLGGDALGYLPLLAPEDPLNVVGRVAQRPGGTVVEVTDPAGLVRVGELGETTALTGLTRLSDPPASAAPATILRSDTGGGLAGLVSSPTSLLAAALLGLASAVLAAIRRRRASRLLAARVAVRLRQLRPKAGDQAGARS